MHMRSHEGVIPTRGVLPQKILNEQALGFFEEEETTGFPACGHIGVFNTHPHVGQYPCA